ncbi:hypothetical protein THAOC_10958 [Thalassiosira oceanica]|uniref:Uncharacterized protein n=1 Tax=Thalassiosira oceanica TaxID=159749 RepID=K0SSE8_THAOC|nr:hypothetical protein THAOC_10958 [Thalassiosira oceanica]|eukprot:EJK67929.1 hypothetical protein THAOC_10958 [Thalassiosira oceanica]
MNLQQIVLTLSCSALAIARYQTDSKKGWRHDNFIRGDVDRVALIKRIEIKGKSTSSRQRKRSRRTATAKKELHNSSAPVSASAASVGGCVSESEVSSISSNSAEPPLEVLSTVTLSGTVPSKPTHETAQESPRQLNMPGHLRVPSQVSYNPTTSSGYIQYTPAFLAQTTAPLVQSIDPISISRNSMALGGPSSDDFLQFAQMMEVKQEDPFDVAVRKMFS